MATIRELKDRKKPEPLPRVTFPLREHPCLGGCGKYKENRGSWTCYGCVAKQKVLR